MQNIVSYGSYPRLCLYHHESIQKLQTENQFLLKTMPKMHLQQNYGLKCFVQMKIHLETNYSLETALNNTH